MPVKTSAAFGCRRFPFAPRPCSRKSEMKEQKTEKPLRTPFSAKPIATRLQEACPECGSSRLYKDGLRYTNTGPIQRFLCRDCGYRFTETSKKAVRIDRERQLCVTETKKLDTAQKNKFCAGDVKKVDADTKGLLTQFYAYMEKEAYSVESDYVDKVKHLAVLGANLKNPEHVKTVIGQMKRKNGQKIKNGTKFNGICQPTNKRTMTPLFLTKPS